MVGCVMVCRLFPEVIALQPCIDVNPGGMNKVPCL